ncbi:MAG: DUF721 domain-containing protein [bacterium]
MSGEISGEGAGERASRPRGSGIVRATPRHRAGPAESVGQVMPRLLRRLKLDGRIRENMGVLGWREAVGETVARRTETLAIRRGTLWVAVESSVWLNELSARRKEILDKLAAHAGHGTIRDVRFVMKGSAAAEDAKNGSTNDSLRSDSEGDYGEEKG